MIMKRHPQEEIRLTASREEKQDGARDEERSENNPSWTEEIMKIV